MSRATAPALLFLASCIPATAPEAGEPMRPLMVMARLGGAANVAGVSVRPIAVVEDSRCPRDVTCVWAGRLRLRVAISGVAGEPVLTLGEPYALRRGTLTLISALPEPRRDPPSGPASRFGFRRD